MSIEVAAGAIKNHANLKLNAAEEGFRLEGEAADKAAGNIIEKGFDAVMDKVQSAEAASIGFAKGEVSLEEAAQLTSSANMYVKAGVAVAKTAIDSYKSIQNMPV